jgi:hypothetical protein
MIINIITSIFVTDLITIQVLFIPILFVLYLNNRNRQTEITEENKTILSSVKTILIFNVLWALIYFLSYIPLMSDTVLETNLYGDNYYYVNISETIWNTGNENILNGINYSEYFDNGTSPYHYFELYQNQIQSKFFNISPLWSFLISVPILLGTLASILIFSFINSLDWKTKKIFPIATAVLLVFVSGMNVLPLEYTEKGNFTMQMINHVSPKYLMLFICLLGTGLLITMKQYRNATIIFLCIPIFSYMMLPVVLFSLLIGNGLLWIFKRINSKEFLLILFYVSMSTLFIVLFYRITSIPIEYQRLGLEYSKVLDSFLNDPITVFKRIIGSHFYYSADYLLYIICLIAFITMNWQRLLKRTLNLETAVFFVLLLEGAFASTWLLNDFHIQAWQPQYFTSGIGSSVMIILIFLTCRERKTILFKSFSALILSISLFNLYGTVTTHYTFNHGGVNSVSQTFMESFKDLLNETKSVSAIGFLETDPIYPTVYPVGKELMNAVPELRLECIDLSILSTENTNHLICTFYQFAEAYPELDKNTWQLEFMNKNNMRYFIGRQQLDESSVLFQHSHLILEDPVSGLYIREIILKKDS